MDSYGVQSAKDGDYSHVRKGQLQHPLGAGLSPAEQFYLLVTKKNQLRILTTLGP